MNKLLLKCVAGDVWNDELDLEADEARIEKFFEHLDECPYHQAIAEQSFKELSKKLKAYNLAFGATDQVMEAENQILKNHEEEERSEHSVVGIRMSAIGYILCESNPFVSVIRESSFSVKPNPQSTLPDTAKDKKILPIKDSRFNLRRGKGRGWSERNPRNISFAVDLKIDTNPTPKQPPENRNSKDLYKH